MPTLANICARVPIITLILATLIATLYLNYPRESELFQELALTVSWNEELWRLLTCHLLHTDNNHLLWNIAALLILGSIVEINSRRLAILSWLVGCAFVSIWFVLQSTFSTYVGLSGALNTVFVVSLYVLADRKIGLKGNEILWLIFFVYLSKNVFESISGTALISSTFWDPTPGAHIAGMLGGATICLTIEALQKAKARHH